MIAAPAAERIVSTLSQPLFTLETSGVAGTKKRPMPWKIALHPSLMDIGIGLGVLSLSYGFYVWASGRDPLANLVPGEAPLTPQATAQQIYEAAAAALRKIFFPWLP